MDKKQKIVIILQYIVIFLFLLLVGSGLVVSPLFGDINVIDEGQFAGWISHMMAGKYLYKDVYAAYGPFYIYPIYILSKIFSPTVFIIRLVLMVVYTFLATIIAQKILKTLKVSYLLQVFCIVCLLVVPGFGMRQGIGLLSIFLAYISLTHKNYKFDFILGVSVASAFLISSDMGIFSFLVVGLLLVFDMLGEDRKMSLVLNRVLMFTLGIAVIFVGFFIWSASEGWFYSYVNSITTDLTVYSGIALPNGQNYPNLLEMVPSSLSIVSWVKFLVSQQMLLYWLSTFYILTFIYLFIKFVLRKINQIDVLIFGISFFGFLLSTILIGRSGHFSFTLSPMFILSAYFVQLLYSYYVETKKKSEKIICLFIMLILFSFSLRIISVYRPHFADVVKIPGAIVADRSKTKFVGPIAISKKQEKSFQTIKSFIDQRTRPNEDVFFLGNEPLMYLIVNRADPTRYDLPEVADIKEKRLEILNDLILKKTRYIIYDLDSWSVDGVSNYSRLPEVVDYINKNYTKSRFANFIIYTLK